MKNSWTLFLILGYVILGCEAYTGFRYLENADIHPPVLLSYSLDDASTLHIQYDENTRVIQSETSVTPTLGEITYTYDEQQVEVLFSVPTMVGTKYTLQLFVKDTKGNSAAAAIPFYGYNDQIPRVLINEFISEGSKTHPDIVELRIMEDGNMGGLTIYDGTPGMEDESFTFPSLALTKGEFVLVHWKPSGDASEINEQDDITASQGSDAQNTAWDYWVEDGNGLPNTTGIIVLMSYPHGDVLDAVAYTTKTYTADSPLKGFGRSGDLAQLQWLVDQEAWNTAGEDITPDDLIPSEDSTSTRSINRSSQSQDTDHHSDWHIAPSRGSTLGAINTDEKYIKN